MTGTAATKVTAAESVGAAETVGRKKMRETAETVTEEEKAYTGCIRPWAWGAEDFCGRWRL